MGPGEPDTRETDPWATGQPEMGSRGNLWPDREVNGLRERWRELQLLFVDDPRAAVEGADEILGQTIEVLNGSLQATRADLAEWRQRDMDTEAMRMAVRRYRAVLDRVLAV
jgi:hypothetical protein